MNLFFYNIFLFLFRAGVPIAALFNIKAKKWLAGRKDVWTILRSQLAAENIDRSSTRIAWMHCASLGEFEQGRPLLEKIRSGFPGTKILLTFFSPSGYEVRKNYAGADWVFYLPLDGRKNARKFLDIIDPSLVIFVKYEYWFYYLREIRNRNVPVLLVSALFREKTIFFRWYGGLQRKMLTFFTHLFVQDALSKQLLTPIGLGPVTTVSGDTRFDRVIEIAEQAEPLLAIAQLVAGRKVVVAGSTWPADETLLKETLDRLNDAAVLLVIAPHEINANHIAQLTALYPQAVLFSQLQNGEINKKLTNVLIMDNIGMLSKLYRYADIAYIGGGFGKGIHNTLEAAVYGKPLLFGPVHEKFKEARDLVKAGAAFPVQNPGECIGILQKLFDDQPQYKLACKQAREYVYVNRGATAIILRFIQEKRLLTS